MLNRDHFDLWAIGLVSLLVTLLVWWGATSRSAVKEPKPVSPATIASVSPSATNLTKRVELDDGTWVMVSSDPKAPRLVILSERFLKSSPTGINTTVYLMADTATGDTYIVVSNGAVAQTKW